MALPPIITNSPVYKALLGEAPRASKGQAEKNSTGPNQDRVEISDEALRRAEQLKSEDLASQGTARKTAADLRTSLEKDPSLSLGIDLSAADL